MYSAKPLSTSAIAYGKKYENPAKTKINEEHNVADCGFIIPPLVPMFGYSPDGIIMVGDCPSALLEVKCPVRGADMKICDMVASGQIPYLKVSDEEISLTKNIHTFGQIQLGMALTGLDCCHFAVYGSKHNDILSIKVYRDDAFINTFLKKLVEIYFNEMLPVLAEM
ncbi:Uncharacterised protein r2_g1408 [Pycnogonum litorale]